MLVQVFVGKDDAQPRTPRRFVEVAEVEEEDVPLGQGCRNLLLLRPMGKPLDHLRQTVRPRRLDDAVTMVVEPFLPCLCAGKALLPKNLVEWHKADVLQQLGGEQGILLATRVLALQVGELLSKRWRHTLEKNVVLVVPLSGFIFVNLHQTLECRLDIDQEVFLQFGKPPVGVLHLAPRRFAHLDGNAIEELQSVDAIHHHLEVRLLVVVALHDQCPVVAKQLHGEGQPFAHHG